MYRPSIMKPLLLSLLLIGVALSPLTMAGKDDFKLPIKVDSKTQFVDGKRKTSIFKEDVHISQGSLKIDADEVEVIAEEGKGKEIFIARGKPAVYSQIMDDGSSITAKANEIRYQVDTRMLDLRGAAELYQDASMVKGEKISFNLEKEQLIAGSEGGESRVTTVFQPEDDDDQQPNN